MTKPVNALDKFIERISSDPFKNRNLELETTINRVPTFKPPTYEQSVFKRMADDIKEPMQQQLSAIEDIADSAKIQAESSVTIADSAKTQADISLAKAKKADLKGWIAILISSVALLFEFAINHKAIVDFLYELFN